MSFSWLLCREDPVPRIWVCHPIRNLIDLKLRGPVIFHLVDLEKLEVHLVAQENDELLTQVMLGRLVATVIHALGGHARASDRGDVSLRFGFARGMTHPAVPLRFTKG